MKKLLIYLKDYKKETVFAPLFKMLEATFELFVPLVMAAIIDRGIGRTDTGYVLKMGSILVALGLIGLLCSITAQYFAAKAAVGFSTGLKHALFDHIQSLSFTEIDTLGTSTLITRMTSDVNQVQNGVNMVLRLFLRSPFIVFGAMIMAFTIDGKAAMIFVVTIPLLAVVVFGIMALTMPMYKKVQAGLDAVLGATRENLTGARVIRAFHKEEEETERFEEKNDVLTHLQLVVGRISALTNPVTYIIINAATIILLYTGAVRVDGRDVKTYGMEELREKIGIVLQKAVLFRGTIRDNLLWGNGSATDEELWEALRLAQAKEFVETKEGRLDAPVAQEGRNLSGGQRQRLTIARALVGKPEILILDDSASALDYATDAALRRALKELPGEPTVFIVSQRASSIRHADQIIVLEDGEMAGCGTHEELLAGCEVYQEIYYSQYAQKNAVQN